MSEYDLFFSYQHDIQVMVKELLTFLKKKYGWRIYLDILENRTGKPLANQLSCSIDNSSVFVCFITLKYSQSNNCKDEFEWAVNVKKKTNSHFNDGKTKLG